MNFLAKTAIASMAIVGMVHADTMLIGVDAGLTVGGARLGVVAGITAGSARNYTAPKYSTACGSAVAKVDPCSFVCGPCEVIKPPCDPCSK
jgi:hypothetical protein